MSSRIEEPTQAKTLDEISNDNMVYYFKIELERIERGEKARDLLPIGVLFRFRKMGLFHSRQSNLLSDKALNMLQELRI